MLREDIDKMSLNELAEILGDKGISEFKIRGMYIKMFSTDERRPEINPESLKELEKLSKIPTDEEILMNPFAGLPEG